MALIADWLDRLEMGLAISASMERRVRRVLDRIEAAQVERARTRVLASAASAAAAGLFLQDSSLTPSLALSA